LEVDKIIKSLICFCRIFLLLFVLSIWGGNNFCQAQLENQDCIKCHSKPDFKKVLPSGESKSLYVDFSLFYRSVHKKELCVYCHNDVKKIPHPFPLSKVDCRRCHYKGNLAGAPDLDIYAEYVQSVHGMDFAFGDPKAPSCQDCHGSHNIFPPSDTLSRINKVNVPETCGKCHITIYNVYNLSIHGKGLQQRIRDVPVCNDCHEEHNIRKHTDPKSPVFLAKVSSICAKCHGNMAIMKKYGIPTEPVETYKESFHGVAAKFGAKTVADCNSCHGSHDIFPQKDPRSSINLKNIPTTCGKCHPGASENFAKGKTHVNPAKPEAGIIYYVSRFFKYLTLSVMLALIIYIILDLRKKFKTRKT
jgi:hypothetical protein